MNAPEPLRPDPGVKEYSGGAWRSRRFQLAIAVMFLPFIIGVPIATWQDFGWVGLAVLGGGIAYLSLVIWLIYRAVDGGDDQ